VAIFSAEFEDLSLFRAFPLGGLNRRKDLRLEGFNITNTPKFGSGGGPRF
jgi:hypothetical protein